MQIRTMSRTGTGRRMRRAVTVVATAAVTALAGTIFCAAPAGASTDVLVNGDFSGGTSGWTPYCTDWGANGAGPELCAGSYATSASGFTWSGSYPPYKYLRQTVQATADSVLTGKVEISPNTMSQCGGDSGVFVTATLFDGSGSTLGQITFGHHPYYSSSCSFTGSNNTTSYYQDEPTWYGGTGPQSFSMDVGSIIANDLTGVQPSKVSAIQVQLEQYADLQAPTVTFSNLSLVTTPLAAPLSASGAQVTATEGQVFSGAVASFSDADTQAAGDYSATIDWGDGHTSAGQVSQTGSGQYAVSGSNTYGEEGSFPVSVSITDTDGTSAAATTAASVADATLTPGTLSVGSAGEAGSPTTVSFGYTDTNPGASTSDFTASINWGDGTTTPEAVTGSGGSYTVSASHTYAEEGNYPVSVSVVDDGGQATDTAGTATVADAAVAVSGETLMASSVTQFCGAVGTITDASPSATASDFSAGGGNAIVNWGDGSSSDTTNGVTVSGPAGGPFTISGCHTYASPDAGTSSANVRFHYADGSTGGGWSGTKSVVPSKPYTIQVAVTDAGGSTGSATTNIQLGNRLTISGSMDGNLAVRPGDTVRAGYDLTIPGSHPAVTDSVFNDQVTMTLVCPDNATVPLTITMAPNPQTYTDAQNSSAWLPSGDQASTLTYQGEAVVPVGICSGQTAHAPSGATFTAYVGQQ